jgi:ArsR family transcriptional regulator
MARLISSFHICLCEYKLNPSAEDGFLMQTAAPAVIRFDPNGQPQALQRAVAFLKVLGHEGRLELLCHMIDGERSVGALTQALGSSQPAVSQHLMRLRAEGLVRTERRGKSVLYSIAAPEIAKVLSALRDAFCAETDLAPDSD